MTAHGNNHPWHPQRVERLKALWAEGRTAGEIATIFGNVTRAAVIGKANRLGLAARAAPKTFSTYMPNVRRDRAPVVVASMQAGAVNARRGRPPKPGPQLKPGAVFGEIGTHGADEARRRIEACTREGVETVGRFTEAANDDSVLLIERRFGQCSWPVGDPVRPAEQMCCGRAVPEGANRAVPTYCARHGAKAVSRTRLGGAPDAKAYERSLRRVVG